ncbi:vacuolar protein sorting-associated protein 26C isoform X4 [Helicoverpa zea]|uniref:vacuolar protein sorting-associated protein 26C isoform X4 n=1 Tax=Helicoverpa zea TaxID=7113 RepID=UPI001F58311D|nr:vacuolar protein sorting-associated protein 26C isoform X4 [Helicoverpa zea]
MSAISTAIVLKRASKVYHEGEIIAGVVVVESNSDVRHEGLSLTMEGSVNLQLSTKNVGIFEAFSNSIKQEAGPVKPVRCEITPASIRAAGAGSRAAMPHFQIYAEIDSTVCALDKPLTGKIRVDECSVPIRSIELQLVRVETCGCAEGYSKDATEIQNIQVGEGDVCRARDVPLHMVLPRLFTCPTTTTVNFKIEFELNIAVIFDDDYLVTENFPILLLRSR